jgi:PAS domain-containing protein
VILRVFRGAIAPGHVERIHAHLRDDIYPASARVHGLRSFQSGMRTLPDGSIEFAIISTWDTFDRLVEALGRDLERPRWMGAVGDAYRPTAAEHYELVGEDITGVFPLDGSLVRVFQGALKPQTGEQFFDIARQRQADLIDSGVILASHIGRRLVDRVEEAIYVVLWRDADALARLGGDLDLPAAEHEWDEFFDSWRLAGYDALTRTSPRDGPEPALLLADDDRRYVFVTGAAGELIGRPVGRILGKRVDDLTSPDLRARVGELWDAFMRSGELTGPFEIEGRDGTIRRLGYAARANTPWPGCHASLLVPGAVAPLLEDVDAALGNVGFVARYQVHGG